MKKLTIFVILLLPLAAFAQEKLTIEQCYQLVNSNYPLTLQRSLLEKQNLLDADVVKTEKLPQFDLSAQATYQSDVIQVPIPSIKPLNKDQYRTTISVNQLLYNGGVIDATLQAQSAALKSKQKQVEVSLYQLKKQVNQLFFSILLQQEKQLLLNAKSEQLAAKLKEVKSGIAHGVLLPASDKLINVELLRIKQQSMEIGYLEISLFETLSSLVGKEIEPSIQLEHPQLIETTNGAINRPELELFQLKKAEVEIADLLLSKQTSPKISAFATGGYGNPGLNMLDNRFQAFYTVGVKLKWNIFDWKANEKKRESLSVNKEIIDNETRIFELNTHMQLDQQLSEIAKLTDLITSDSEVIALRREILKSTESQLKNGVITTSTYITDFTNLFEDENKLSTHRIQLMLATANYNTTKGL